MQDPYLLAVARHVEDGGDPVEVTLALTSGALVTGFVRRAEFFVSVSRQAAHDTRLAKTLVKKRRPDTYADAEGHADQSDEEISWRELQRAWAASSDDGHRGRLLGLLDVDSWALERTLSLGAIAEFEVSSHAHEFLKALVDTPGRSNGDLAERLGTSDAEISRVGARLLAAGVAIKRRIGRRNHWDITPRGIHTLELLERGGVSRHFRPHGAIV